MVADPKQPITNNAQAIKAQVKFFLSNILARRNPAGMKKILPASRQIFHE
jgi:hypothetical protein